MSRYHPRTLPAIWLMTDERMGEALWPALSALPRGAGIVFRHYATEPAPRRALFRRISRFAHTRRAVLLVAGDQPLPGGDGAHNRRGAGLRSAAVHSIAEARGARRAGVDLVFVSPVFASRSHPGRGALGPRKAARIARVAGIPAIALGGMDARRFRQLRNRGFHGWAAIDAWTARGKGQKRNAVPI